MNVVSPTISFNFTLAFNNTRRIFFLQVLGWKRKIRGPTRSYSFISSSFSVCICQSACGGGGGMCSIVYIGYCIIKDGGMDSGISSILNTSFLHGSQSSLHSVTLIFFCVMHRSVAFLAVFGILNAAPRQRTVVPVQHAHFPAPRRRINLEVVIKYVTTNKLEKGWQLEGWGQCHEMDILLKVLALLCDWSMFSSVDPSVAAGKMSKNNLSQAASGMIFVFLKSFSVSKSPLQGL